MVNPNIMDIWIVDKAQSIGHQNAKLVQVSKSEAFSFAERDYNLVKYLKCYLKRSINIFNNFEATLDCRVPAGYYVFLTTLFYYLNLLARGVHCTAILFSNMIHFSVF